MAIKNISENTTKIGKAPGLIVELLDCGLTILTDIITTLKEANWKELELIGIRWATRNCPNC